MNNFPKNDRAKGIAILSHELKHFFQFKEELLTGNPAEAIENLIEAKAKNLRRKYPQLTDKKALNIVQGWYIEDGDYKSHIYDILLHEGWAKNEIDDVFGKKAQEYLKNEEHYIDKDESLTIDKTLKAYENQITEREAYEVGDAVGTAFNKSVLGIDRPIRTKENLSLENITNIN